MATTEDVRKQRKIYGRGYYDGIAAATREFNLNASRIAQLERGLSAVCSKVWRNMPVDINVRTAQVVTHLAHKGIVQETKVVEGCLGYLTKIGLIKEPMTGMWFKPAPKIIEESHNEKGNYMAATVNVAPKAIGAGEVTVKNDQAKNAQQAKTPLTLFEKIAAVSASLRSQSEMLAECAAKLDDIALEVDASMSAESEAAKTLAALRKLMAG